MIYGSKEIELSLKTTIEDIMGDVDNDKHYFYIIQLPRCGSSRIKIGKSELLHKRFSEYANMFYGSDIYVLRLISFPKKHYTGNEKTNYPNALFEQKMKAKLKKVQGKTSKKGYEIQTEWYDYKHKQDVISMFDILKNESSTDTEHVKRTSERIKIGDIIEVLWKMEGRKKEYLKGKVFKVGANTFTIKYDDGDTETHKYTDVSWRPYEGL